jgi:hypothetical protein
MSKDFRGFVALHRKLLDDPIFKNQNTLQVFIYCLLKATHKDYTVNVGDQFVELKPGEFVSGRKVMMQDLNMGEQTVRTTVKNLKKLEFLTIKSTNKYSIFTISKWNDYQQTNQPVTSSKPHTITSNNSNKFIPPTVDEVANHLLTKKLSPAMAKHEAKRFVEYYGEANWVMGNKKKMSNWKQSATGWNNRRIDREKNTGNSGKSSAARTAENIQKEFGQGNSG